MTILNKKTFLYFIISFFFTGLNLVFADPIDKSDAAFAARNFYEELNPVRNSDFTAPVLDQSKSSCGGFAMSAAIIEEETHHIFEFEGGGYIIMSADDNAPPILGYSFNSEQINDEIPPQLEEILQQYRDQIIQIREDNLDNPDAQAQWDDLLTSDFDSSELETDGDVGALIKTSWNQCTGYNNYAPSDGSSVCGNNRVPIGCVATAMGQVMKYHNYPETGFGSHSYSSDYGTLSANFGATTYDWSGMPNASGNNAVSRLLYHCAVALNMDFGPGGSSTYTGSVDNVLEMYFNYDTAARYVYKSNYSTTGWRNLIRSQINAGQPVVYRGSGTGGHAFNVDGYKTGNNTFHLNWGWGGSYNGYYLLGDLTPGGYNFKSGQAAIIDIKPLRPSYFGTILKGDFDGDGEDGLSGLAYGYAYWLEDLSDSASWTKLPGKPSKIISGDFDGDGSDELACIAGDYTYWLEDLTTSSSWTRLPGKPTIIISGDFDGDGSDELACIAGGYTYWLEDLATSTSWTRLPGKPSKIISGDFDGDGSDELACIAGGYTYWLEDLATSTSWTRLPGKPSKIISGDFDGDGSDELACIVSTGYAYWLKDLETSTSWTRLPGKPSKIISGDFDGDGSDELACIAGDYTYWLEDLATSTSWTRLPGKPSKIVSGDFDDDNINDELACIASGKAYLLEDIANDTSWTKLP